MMLQGAALLPTPLPAPFAAFRPAQPPLDLPLSLEAQVQILNSLRSGEAHRPAPAPALPTDLLSLLSRAHTTAEQAPAPIWHTHSTHNPSLSYLEVSAACTSARNDSAPPSSAGGSPSPGVQSDASTHPRSGAGESDGESEGEEGDTQMSLIFTRRRAGQSARFSNDPVLLNKKRVKKLFELPLKEAADELGISMTALKKACRKIGVDRWPYRKCPVGSSTTKPPKHASLGARAEGVGMGVGVSGWGGDKGVSPTPSVSSVSTVCAEASPPPSGGDKMSLHALLN